MAEKNNVPHQDPIAATAAAQPRPMPNDGVAVALLRIEELATTVKALGDKVRMLDDRINRLIAEVCTGVEKVENGDAQQGA